MRPVNLQAQLPLRRERGPRQVVQCHDPDLLTLHRLHTEAVPLFFFFAVRRRDRSQRLHDRRQLEPRYLHPTNTFTQLRG